MIYGENIKKIIKNKTINKWFIEIGDEIHSSYKFYIILFVILTLALFVRVYRIDQLLGFYFDQGRDAKVIWDFSHNGKFFLIGPTTGIEGIFRGPWYYWMLTPFYILGNGNPVWPSVFLSFTTVLAILVAYVVGKEVAGRGAGMLAAFITAFSFYFIQASRWLSNPTPMLLISMLLVFFLFRISEGKRWAWAAVGFLLGLAMQFGSAAEIFYLPAVGLFALWLVSQKGQRNNLPTIKIFVVAFCLLLMTALPQIVFDLRHEGVLREGIARFLFQEDSFKLSFWEVVKNRLPFYFDVFASKLFLGYHPYREFFMFAAVGLLIFHIKELLRNKKFLVLLIVFITPLVGMLFFQGNYGNVYDYYFTGYYLVFVVLFSSVMVTAWQHTLGGLVLSAFLLTFTVLNSDVTKGFLISGVDGPNTILFGNQKQAVDWVYQDARDQPFNVDVYVPPVIPHAYDYLFLWWGTTRYGKLPVLDQQLSPLYTLYEQDPPHPERLEAWTRRQEKIGTVEEEVRFGGITVQRRERISNEENGE